MFGFLLVAQGGGEPFIRPARSGEKVSGVGFQVSAPPPAAGVRVDPKSATSQSSYSIYTPMACYFSFAKKKNNQKKSPCAATLRATLCFSNGRAL